MQSPYITTSFETVFHNSCFMRATNKYLPFNLVFSRGLSMLIPVNVCPRVQGDQRMAASIGSGGAKKNAPLAGRLKSIRWSYWPPLAEPNMEPSIDSNIPGSRA